MTKDSKQTHKTGDPELDLHLIPFFCGKISGARIMGGSLVKKNKAFSETERFSDEFMEYIGASSRLINFLSGLYHTIEEVFGKGYGKEMFDRVIAAHTDSKADQKMRQQIGLLRRYLADPKRNASRVAREKLLTTSKLTWRFSIL